MLELQPVHDELCRRLSVHEDAFLRSHNLTDANAPASRKAAAPSPETYVLLAGPTDRYPDGQLFASVKLGKRYVSYYLMSMYLDPASPALSDELSRRRQGKSCFNFTKVDHALFDELGVLTAAGREFYGAQGLLRA